MMTILLNIAKKRSWVIWLAAIVSLVLMTLASMGRLFWKPLRVGPVPTFAEVRGQHRRTDAVLLDRHGEVLHRLRIDPRGRRLAWTPLEAISPALVTAVVQAEDRRFNQHGGVDWQALAAVALRGAQAGSWRGASTLTMQLASRLDPQLEPRRRRRTLEQKFQQIRMAIELEKRWSKAEILEAYLNLVTFRGELQGIAAASLGLFGKQPHGLSPLESLILAVLLRSPNARPKNIASRAVGLARSLNWEIIPTTIEGLVNESTRGPYRMPLEAAWAPHLASSLNIPAVKTLNLVGVEPFVRELRLLGFRDLKAADYYGPSSALGAADVAFLLGDILSDRESRSGTFSLESPLATRFWTAVKTGTSKDMRDNWCVGYSSRYTVGVWVGNFSGEPMWNVLGITGAAPIWVEIMNWLHRNQSSRQPSPPEAIQFRTPQPGMHSLRLLTASGETVDTVRFVVRGKVETLSTHQ